ncbi:hypothetical protein MKK68_15865 [Methylobacterium sp. E-016]|uniref:hypothetical protein n=1 Tax=Methylobacterium sp. E-016 TaxID=2836556 RepID=UPI001FBBDFAA|nr:hypothetical protein [Methylobacterium sp. E-016]MCJ2077107.1 hypothetical protein [Methylobacterium sp. E-016]
MRGAQEGADDGRAAGGPIGAIVVGAIGAATGTVNGILGVDCRPPSRTHVCGARRASSAHHAGDGGPARLRLAPAELRGGEEGGERESGNLGRHGRLSLTRRSLRRTVFEPAPPGGQS